MQVHILNRYTTATIVQGPSVREAVMEAVRRKKSLACADLKKKDLSELTLAGVNFNDAGLQQVNLRGADLRKATLQRANLTEADLSEANLSGAGLQWANLNRATLYGADLSGADLLGSILRGADLRDAILEGVDLCGVGLDDVNLCRTRGLPVAPAISDLDGKILRAVQLGGGFDMSYWHQDCGTTHCRAGWAITLARGAGKQLEDRYGSAVAGALIYAASYPTLRVPNFTASNKEALADMQARAKGTQE